MGMLVGVTDCGKGQKWCCRGRLARGFKPRHGSHTRSWDHSALAERRTLQLGQESGPRGLGSLLLPRGLGSRRDFAWNKRGERTLAGGP